MLQSLFGWGCSVLTLTKKHTKEDNYYITSGQYDIQEFLYRFFLLLLLLFALFFFFVCECILSIIFVWINWSVWTSNVSQEIKRLSFGKEVVKCHCALIAVANWKYSIRCAAHQQICIFLKWFFFLLLSLILLFNTFHGCCNGVSHRLVNLVSWLMSCYLHIHFNQPTLLLANGIYNRNFVITYCARSLYLLIHVLILALYYCEHNFVDCYFWWTMTAAPSNNWISIEAPHGNPKMTETLFALYIIGLIEFCCSTCQQFPMISEHQTRYQHPVLNENTQPAWFHTDKIERWKPLICIRTLIFKWFI